MHCTFTTKERFPFIEPELESRLWPYIGGIARENRIKPLAIGGIANHIPALLSLPATMSFAKAAQLTKVDYGSLVAQPSVSRTADEQRIESQQ
jgi:REP element-mobilizing transposase RayT